MTPRHVLITGASSGMGAALARAYARGGMALSLTARNAARLGEIADRCRESGADVDAQTLDVGDGAALSAWIGHVDGRTPVDLVIANAGVGGKGAMAGARGEPLSVARELVTTNILGVANAVIPLVPRFVERRKGHIAIMSSLAAFLGLPQAPLYSASKAAVRSYGHGLRRLLAPKGVAVSVICPGFVETPMSATVPGRRPFLWDADRAASHIVAGLERGRREIVFPWQLAATVRIAGILPAALLDRLLSHRMKA